MYYVLHNLCDVHSKLCCPYHSNILNNLFVTSGREKHNSPVSLFSTEDLMQNTQKLYKNVSVFLPVCTAAETISIILMRVQFNFFFGPEDLSVMGVNISAFWDITQCRSVEAHKHFRRTNCPHLQVRGWSKQEARKKHADISVASCRLLVQITFKFEDGGSTYFSLTSVDFCRTVLCYILEDSAPFNFFSVS
jgi:hypothetical protein